MSIGHEFLESILRDWTKNLWMENNKDRITDEASKREVEKELHREMFPNNNRGLTRAQSFSEQSFVLFAYGLTYSVGLVSDKAAEKISNTKLVDAWRKAVHRNSFQQKYNLFEKTLKETLDTRGEQAALAAYPDYTVSAQEVVSTLEEMGYKPKVMATQKVSDLIRKTTPKRKATP